MAAVSLLWDTNMADVTSCENTLLNNAAVTEASLKLTPRIGLSSACPFKRRQHR